MLATLIQRYDKKSFHFKNERLTEILQAVRCPIWWLYYTIYQFIKSFLDNKMSIFEGYGAFKWYSIFKITKMGSVIPKEIKYNLHRDDVWGDFTAVGIPV